MSALKEIIHWEYDFYPPFCKLTFSFSPTAVSWEPLDFLLEFVGVVGSLQELRFLPPNVRRKESINRGLSLAPEGTLTPNISQLFLCKSWYKHSSKAARVRSYNIEELLYQTHLYMHGQQVNIHFQKIRLLQKITGKSWLLMLIVLGFHLSVEPWIQMSANINFPLC